MSAPVQTTNSNDLSSYLAPGCYVDSDHPAVIALARRVADPSMTSREIAVKLYYAVRDEFLYDPYYIDTTVDGLKASHVIEAGRGFCVPKAALLAAAARALGVPARPGYADVRNHLTSKRLYDMMGTDLFVFHGYTELWLDGQWIKATPAFNRSLCEKAGIRPLEFDGSADSVFHEFDPSGRRHMEYVQDRGAYADLPREKLLALWRQNYKTFAEWGQVAGNGGDFAQEVGQPS
jgi:transglutaminase-like putative cysteine protease